jgi:hypothetical protein
MPDCRQRFCLYPVPERDLQLYLRAPEELDEALMNVP